MSTTQRLTVSQYLYSLSFKDFPVIRIWNREAEDGTSKTRTINFIKNDHENIAIQYIDLLNFIRCVMFNI